MTVIYEPEGKAKEYSPLACNLYGGCSHACKYCYCPAIRYKTLEEWSANPQPRKDILKKLGKEAIKLQGDEREILFCFMSDPYQSNESAELTKQALLICEKYQLKAQILTKAGQRVINHFDILKRNNYKFGSTIIMKSESLREYWEPGAPTIESRYNAIKEAKKYGIYTWISVEPVVDASEALQVISDLIDYVDFWKLGKLNHFSKKESYINWKDYLQKAEKILQGKKYYIKNDLVKYK